MRLFDSTAVYFRLKITSLAVLAVLNSACGGGGSSAQLVESSNPDSDVNELTAEQPTTAQPLPSVLSGVFIDSPVANLDFKTSSGEGKTNQHGEFYYQRGEKITFSLGEIEFPPLAATDVITPLDLFQATSVTDIEVVNLSRLLQTLDIDSNPDNGIELPDDTAMLSNTIVFDNTEAFEASTTAALQSAGISAPIVESAIAVTHLSNSLLERGLVAVDQISSQAVQFDDSRTTQLADLDNDGIADIFDWDDDGDGVNDTVDVFPLDANEAFDLDSDGIGNNTDSDDDNDGIEDANDDFPLTSAESIDTDKDGYGNELDTDDDNDGVPDIFDAFPLDATEQLDTDDDGIGNNVDSDDDGDGYADTNDAFPLVLSEWKDIDGDLIGDNFDLDDDNDGVPDSIDLFPTVSTEQRDTDNDGTGNNSDPDDDNDGFVDTFDAFPLISSESKDTDGDGLGNNFDLDDDNDGVPDTIDAFPQNPAEQLDTDNDGIGNNEDTDDDDDGIADAADPSPLLRDNANDLDGDGYPDSVDDDNDNDGVHDALDQFPNDSTEHLDNDKDGIGDNADTDDDNDGTPDTEDALPLNPSETSDLDGDGIGDNADRDSDNDGVEDFLDHFPLDDSESRDFDGDGIGNNADPDDDDDGVEDAQDAFPLNPYESNDLDSDGIGDNSDYDRDNDGYEDYWDAFPDDPMEYLDSDGDGIGNNADPDDDNDNTPDTEDLYPTEAYYGADTDGDGEQDQWDSDDDNDGILDRDDEMPKDPAESKDTDGDGIGDNADTDDDNDSVADSEDFAPLNPNCSAEADSIGGMCIADFSAGIVEVVNLGDNAFWFNPSATAAMQTRLSTQEVLSHVDLSAHATADDTITSVLHSTSHDRIYVGFSSGVVVYFTADSTSGTYFHTLPDSVDNIVEAGNLLLMQSDHYYNDAVYVIDIDGVQLSSHEYAFDSIKHAAWRGTTNTAYTIEWGDRLDAREIDQTTGAVTYGTGFSSTNNIVGPLSFSPDDSLLLSGNGQTFVFGDTVSTAGDITTGTFIDFAWNNASELISISANGANTTIEHRTADYTVAESILVDGTPLSLLKDDGLFYVVTSTDGDYSIHSYVPSDDSDNDLVLNINDAFPRDPSASVDTDNDGSPDNWNTGYSASGSTTGLTIDAYPEDPACFLESDGNGSHCYYDLIVPDATPATIIHDGSLTYLHYTDENLIFIRDNATDTYLTPVFAGEDNGTNSPAPTYMELHTGQNRLYLGYASGNVTYIDLSAAQPIEAYFTTLAESVRGIASAGQYVMFVDYSGAWESHHYYDIDGVQTASEDWNYYSLHFAWNDVLNRLFFFRDTSTPNDLMYEDIDTGGAIVGDGDSPYHGDYTIAGPILVTPDNNYVLLGAGEYYDATSLERVGSISRSFEHGVFLDDGRLAILKKNGSSDAILAYYDIAYAPISGVTTFTGVEPVGITFYDDTLTVITYSSVDGLVFHDILNP